VAPAFAGMTNMKAYFETAIVLNEFFALNPTGYL